MATSFHSDDLNLFQHPDSDDPADSELFHRDPQEEETTLEYTDPNDARLTIQMTSLFLVLMVLYVGFFAYRWSKMRQSVGTYLEGENGERVDRTVRRQQNQMVLDETISASTRAQLNAEEHAKLEERKMNIKRALVLRLIVEEEEFDLVEECSESQTAPTSGEETKGETLLVSSSAGSTSTHKRETLTVAAIAPEKAAAVKHTTGAEAQASCDDVKVPSMHNQVDRTEATGKAILAAEIVPPGPTPPSSTLSPPTSPTSTPSLLIRSPLSSPSRLLSDADRFTKVVTNAVCHMTYGTSTSLSCSSVPGKGKGAHTVRNINVSAFIGTYGEECNICLSKFQVGDRAAWSKHQYGAADVRCDQPMQGATLPQGNQCGMEEVITDAGTSTGYRCTHVFHEECISRWLLVRDGCPVCRRSYFSNDIVATETDFANPSLADLERGIRVAG